VCEVCQTKIKRWEKREHKRFIQVHQNRLLPVPTFRVRLSTIVSCYQKLLNNTISCWSHQISPITVCIIILSRLLDHSRKVETTLSQTIKPNRFGTLLHFCMVVGVGRKWNLKRDFKWYLNKGDFKWYLKRDISR